MNKHILYLNYILCIYRSDTFIWRKLRANILAAVFFWSGRGGSKLPSQWPYDARTPPVLREHSIRGACSEPLDPSPWPWPSLLSRPFNLAAKGLGIQARQFSRIRKPPTRASSSLPACTLSHRHARTLTRTLTGTHISSRVDQLVRQSVVGHSLYFRFFCFLVCDYMSEVARNLVPRFRPAQHDFDHCLGL